jgi:hypothetical protein
MTTILVINAISSLLAGCGIGVFGVRRHRARRAVPQPVYVTVGNRRAG